MILNGLISPAGGPNPISEAEGGTYETVQRNPFLRICRPAIPRLFSLLNRNTLSPTYGSFDRNYWHYRTITDFTSPTFQQGVLSLALIYNDPIFGPEYHKNPAIRDFAEAGMRRWAELQHADGSFDEWFPNEFSHVATAFTGYAISEAYRTMKLDSPDCYRALHKAGLWLGTHLDRKVLNHTAGAIAALANISNITEDERIREAFDRNIEVMASYQSPEGWFHENGGFDISYQSVSIDYLTRAHDLVPDPRIAKMLDRAVDFLAHFVFPDGTIGCGIGSRNTQYIFPYGLLRLAGRSKAAEKIARRYVYSLEAGRAITPSAVDDRYFLFFFLPNFLAAAREYQERGGLEPDSSHEPLMAAQSMHFRDAGVVIRRRGSSIFYVNYQKGGVYRYYRGGSLAAADNGYFAKDRNGAVVSNALLNRAEDAMVGDQSILIETSLKAVNYSLPFRSLFIPFRVFNFTLGLFPAVSERMTELIKNFFIRRRKESAWRFRRLIEFLEDGRIRIQDDFPGTEERGLEIHRHTAGTASHVPTSRYFLATDIAQKPAISHGRIVTELEP